MLKYPGFNNTEHFSKKKNDTSNYLYIYIGLQLLFFVTAIFSDFLSLWSTVALSEGWFLIDAKWHLNHVCTINHVWV